MYARKYGEWAELGDWFETTRPWHKHVLYAIQFPRVYHVWKKMKAISNFGELLNNFFGPMFEATLHPKKHENLAKLLKHIKCIDTVDNEAQDDPFFISEYPPANKYDSDKNPPYSYYTFYFWHNLRALNAICQDKGLNTFKFRPHAGEAGPPHHLASTFLFANGISYRRTASTSSTSQCCSTSTTLQTSRFQSRRSATLASICRIRRTRSR